MNLPVHVLCQPITERSINHPFLSPLFALSLQLGCVTTRCCAVRTAARVTTINGAIVPPASRVSCVREFAARAPGSAMTNCLDRPPSIFPTSVASSLLCLYCSCYWLLPFAERPERFPILNQTLRPHMLRMNSQPYGHEWQRTNGPRPQWWVKLLQCVHWSILLMDRRIYERIGGGTAVLQHHRGSDWSLCFLIMSLADTWLKANWRLRQSCPHPGSKLYKTRHTISKYHLKLLKNNNANGTS